MRVVTNALRYRCDPPWWVIGLNLAIAIALVTLFAVGMTATSGMVLASLTTTLGALLAVRRLAFSRHVELTNDSLSLPMGFLRLRVKRIPLDSIEKVWESKWALGTVLYLHVNQKRFEIPCGLGLSRDDYSTVRNFLVKAASDRKAGRLLEVLPGDPSGLPEEVTRFIGELERRANDTEPTIPASELWKRT